MSDALGKAIAWISKGNASKFHQSKKAVMDVVPEISASDMNVLDQVHLWLGFVFLNGNKSPVAEVEGQEYDIDYNHSQMQDFLDDHYEHTLKIYDHGAGYGVNPNDLGEKDSSSEESIDDSNRDF